VLPNKRVLITAISDGDEARALREVVELFHVTADFVGIGETRDLIDALKDRKDVAVIVICCHGKDGAILMPEVGESMASQQPFQGPLTPEHARKHLDLRGQRVLCTGCSTGVSEMGSAFLDAGCEWYVAPSGYPNGAEVFMFAAHFLYLLLHRELNASEAIDQARSADDDRGMFQLFANQKGT